MAHRAFIFKSGTHLAWIGLFYSLTMLGLAYFATPSIAQTIPPLSPTQLPTAALATATLQPPSPTPTDSPTVAATPLPRLYISEFLANPKAVKDEAGEWIELYNADSQSVNLRGWQLRDLGSDHYPIVVDLVIEPGQYVVLARNGDTASNGGVLSSYT